MIGKQFLQCMRAIPRVTVNTLEVTSGTGLLRQPWHAAKLLPQPLTSPTLGHQCCRHLSTTNILADFPPNRDRPLIDYYVPRVKIRRARKTADPEPKPHKFSEIKRSWNMREIPTEEEAKRRHQLMAPEVISRVNTELSEGRAGRLFAVVHVMGKQFLVKTEDLIVIAGHWPPQMGETIRLEKVLAMGGRDFTLYGRPLLPRDQAFVEGTVVEKTLSHTKIGLFAPPRKNTRVWNFLKEELTYLRINNVSVLNKVDELPDVRGVEGKVFGQFEN